MRGTSTRREVAPWLSSSTSSSSAAAPAATRPRSTAPPPACTIAMVEEHRVGGTCLHRGCIPAKELLQTAEVLRTVARRRGVRRATPGQPTLDLARQPGAQAAGRRPAHRRASSRCSRAARSRSSPAPGTLVDADGAPRSASPTAPSCAGNALILATGSAPRVAARASSSTATRVLSSDHVLAARPTCPARVAVIGGGAIGCEFASFLVDVGTEVTILEALPQILAGVDQQVAQTRRARVHASAASRCRPACRSPASTGTRELAVRFEGKNGERAARGRPGRRERRPRARARRASASRRRASRSTSAASSRVDGNMRTSVAGVYAVGDVVADAAARARRASRRRSSRSRRCSARTPRRSTTTRCRGASTATPRSRSAGSPRRRRTSAGYDVVTSVHRWGGNGRALIIGETDGHGEDRRRARRPDPRRAHRRAVGDRADRRGVPRRSTGRRRRPTSGC